jgi:hypothetical protein
MIVQLDGNGGFSVESLRPFLGDKIDLIASYTLEGTDGGIILTLFDGEGNKII